MWHRLFIAGSHGLVAFAFFNTTVFNAARAADDHPAARAIVAVEASIVIQRPAAEVFAFVSNAERWTQRKVEGYMRTLKQFMETPVAPA